MVGMEYTTKELKELGWKIISDGGDWRIYNKKQVYIHWERIKHSTGKIVNEWKSGDCPASF